MLENRSCWGFASFVKCGIIEIMKAEIIGIGTEILLGQIINTNSGYLSKKLAELGIDVFYHTTVGDNPLRLYTAIMRALARSDIVITTGGLGPTVDDITLNVISKVAEEPLVFKKEIARLMESHFKKSNIRMPKNNLRQAYIPKKAKWLKNSVGTAPGIIITKANKLLIALPGPPLEMNPMMEDNLVQEIRKISPKKSFILTRSLKTTGLVESQLHTKVSKLLKLSGDTTVGIYARPGQVDLKITSKAKTIKQAKDNIQKIEKKLKKILGDLIFGVDNETLEGNVVKLLKNKTLAIAESCTGGLLSSRIVDIPKTSKNLIMSVVAYSNKSKTEILDIPTSLLRKEGAVSRAVCKKLANNIRDLAASDIGISITGIAGPGGATQKKPIGLIYIGLSSNRKTFVKEFRFSGERKTIKLLSSQAALDMLRNHLITSK